jgi:hypothetical protein
MKESQSILWTSTMALLVFWITNMLGESGGGNSLGAVVFGIFIVLSSVLAIVGLILTLVKWKKTGIWIRIYGFIPFIIWIVAVAYTVYKISKMD